MNDEGETSLSMVSSPFADGAACYLCFPDREQAILLSYLFDITARIELRSAYERRTSRR